MLILGIDPGSCITGYGLIETHQCQHRYVASGCIRLNSVDVATKLHQIFTALTSLIQRYQPQEVSIEQVFMHKNPGAALKLGQARGVAMVTAATCHLSVSEYSARQIKQAVVGYGAAKKYQVQQMVGSLLNLTGLPQADAADALAAAICHAHSRHSVGSDKIVWAKRRAKRYHEAISA